MIFNTLLFIYLSGVCVRIIIVLTEMTLFVIPHISRTDRIETHVKVIASLTMVPFLTLIDCIGSWLSFIVVPKCIGADYFIERIIKAHVLYFLSKKQSCLDIDRENLVYIHPILLLKELNILGKGFLKHMLSDNIFFDKDFLVLDNNSKNKLKILLELTE